ncbi:MAG: hypothetical protein HFE63_05830 [Clostridiales bacterium]|nr:hypothetical protein [Clostridiales bacterium]
MAENKQVEPQSNKQKRKKTVAVITAAVCVVAVVGLFFLNTDMLTFDFDFDFNFGKSNDTEQYVYDGKGQHRISLYDPDWESDIFENPAYLDKNRYIAYVDGGMTVTIVDGDYAAYGEVVEMLASYIDALMHGDAEAVNSYYADSYFETHERFEAITMQKLYNISVEQIAQKDITINGRGATSYVYKLSYMIMENDGTFRNDLISDAARPQFYTIVDDGYSMLITDVADYYLIEY